MTGPVAGAAGLTAEWLTGALAPALDGAAVTAVTAEPVGTGQVSDSLRLRLDYDRPAGLPATMVAKVPAADPSSRAAARAIRTYEIEAGFYAHLAAGLDASVPACHFSAYEPEADDYAVLLQDLAPATSGDQIAGVTADQAAAAIDEMAVLHAAGWDAPELAALPWLNRHDAEAAAFTAAMVTGLYEGFKERYAARLEPEVMGLIEDFLPSIGGYLAVGDAPPTLAHGDFRADNLLFGGPRPVVLDWQTCIYGPGPSDLAYFLGSSLPVRVRRDHEEALVRRYHAALAARGVRLSWTDCWDAYRRHAFHGIVMAIGAAMLVGRTERGDTMFCTMTARHARHALDLKALALLP
ncbi:phosphotransferase [Actinomadura parmotrematis]|uniref:Ecdysteroid 22-kinase family protein n=1 Tax=Actinomadura parmotrematis TaxID=2864039 RepID=A0ABS7FUN5_9ACTN|nr:phosphotransferase [Actinomadura parmotrematis]MBW8484123.1 ecdysteroid 22-kinase family protein [Actinomadura parmotrematis]